MKNFNDKIVIITGAGKGIGKTAAIAFAKEGAKIGVADVDKDSVERTIKEINEIGGKAIPLIVNVANRSECHNMVKVVVDEFGELDCIVNCAGVNRLVPAENITEDDWDFVQNVNIRGLFWCCQAAGIQMIKQKSGSIINIASCAGIRTRALRASYSSSKAAVMGLTRELAVEWAKHNICVNAIGPSFVKTPMMEKIMMTRKGMEEEIADMHPMDRLALPEEIAKVILFLASDGASFTTGQTIFVDGGYLAYGGKA